MKTRTVLIFENNKNKIEFDINPSEITINEGISNIHENIDSLGEVVLHGKRGLKSITLSSFIPAISSPFNTKNSPKKVKNIIDRWLNKEARLRVIITNPKINFKAILDSASISLKEGSDDLYISLSLSEYKDISVPSVESIKGLIDVGVKSSEKIELSERPSEKPAGKTEVVNKNTTLWSLAIKYYGNGNEWKKIASANGNINPKKLKLGMVLQIP